MDKLELEVEEAKLGDELELEHNEALLDDAKLGIPADFELFSRASSTT